MPSREGAPRYRRPMLGAAAIALVFVLAFLVTVNRTSVRVDAPPAALPSATADVPPTPSLSLNDVARAALDRTVTVESLRAGDEGLGTGWLLDSRGDFVTNAHVIEGQETVRLRTRTGTAHLGTVLGVDRQQDIAVIRSVDGFAGLPLVVRASRLAGLPQPVVTIASSAASGHSDITPESATRFAADVPVTPDTTTSQAPVNAAYHDMLVLAGQQIFPGNSGGPVLDQSGRVVGILTLASKSAAEGFAIPIDRVLAEILGFAAQ